MARGGRGGRGRASLKESEVEDLRKGVQSTTDDEGTEKGGEERV